MWSQRQQYICQQDQVLNRARETLNSSRHPLCLLRRSPRTPEAGHPGPILLGYPCIFSKKDTSFTCPNGLRSGVLATQRARGCSPKTWHSEIQFRKPRHRRVQVHGGVSRFTVLVKVLIAREGSRARRPLCGCTLLWLSCSLDMSVKQPRSYGICRSGVTVVPGGDALRSENPKEERRKLWDWLNPRGD